MSAPCSAEESPRGDPSTNPAQGNPLVSLSSLLGSWAHSDKGTGVQRENWRDKEMTLTERISQTVKLIWLEKEADHKKF